MYIRTKDGVYDGEKYNADYILDYELGKIINQSENLEELCDEFVAKTCDITEYWVEQKLERAKFYCGLETIYGAIWTDRGLIFVAKLNDKGKLELI